MASALNSEAYVEIDEKEAGSRLDRTLLRRLGESQRTLIMRLIRKGNVRVNGRRAKPDQRLSISDRVFLPASLRVAATDSRQSSIPDILLKRISTLEVLYEDDSLIVVNKPAGLVVHGGSGHGAGLVEALKQLRELPDIRLAHRLDRDTSGVLLLSKNISVLRQLTAAFRQREIQKTYFALVSGHPYPFAGRLCSRLTKGVVRSGERMVVSTEEGMESVTDYQVVMESRSNGFDWAMVALKPHSGRTHQLRVQMQSEGHAILGDGKYSDRHSLVAFRTLGGKGLMLHAWRIRFKHPVTKQSMEFHARLPDQWQSFVKQKNGSGV